MRSFVRALVLSLAIAPAMPAIATCQPDEIIAIEEFDDPPPEPQPKRRVIHRRRNWRDSPLVWGGAATALAIMLPFGVFKVVRQMRYMSQQQQREKAPWERDS
jgi:hypothetical protein